MVLQLSFFFGTGVVFLLMTGAGLYAAGKVKSADDFAVGGRQATAALVAGS